MTCTPQTASACAPFETDRAAGITPVGWLSSTTSRGGSAATARRQKRNAHGPTPTTRNTGSRSMKCTIAAWAATVILACGYTAAHAQDAGQTEPMPEPSELPVPEFVVPPVLIPVTVQWRIPDPDPAISDELKFVSIFCGTEADPYKLGSWSFAQPGDSGQIELSVPSMCSAVGYYWDGTTYRYSERSPAVQIDPAPPAGPVLLPQGMETATLRCAASTQRCVTSRLQTPTKSRDGVRTRTCSCILTE